jgi:hypothetical protein
MVIPMACENPAVSHKNAVNLIIWRLQTTLIISYRLVMKVIGMSCVRKLILLTVFSLSLTSPTFALDLSGQSRTYIQSRQLEDATRNTPLHEFLSFRADDIGTQNLSFHVGGWYGYDFGGTTFEDSKGHTGDLQYAVLNYRTSTANSYVSLGRLMVNQGQASSQLDGFALGTDLKWGFGISAFDGIPVETALDTRKGDSVYGGRISQGREGVYRIGVSSLLEKNNGLDFRNEKGLDLWIRPVPKVELLGTSLYNSLTNGVARHAYYLTLGPFSALTLRTYFTEINYKDFFTSNTLSVFQFQPGGPVSVNEKLRITGEEASLAFGPINVSVDFKEYNFEQANNASYYGARLAYSGPASAAGLSIHHMNGQTVNLRYNEYRLYGQRKFGSWADLTADLFNVAYSQEINGVKNALSASLAYGRTLSTRARLTADIEYSKNPYFNQDIRGLVKLVYNFDIAPSPKKGK